MTTRRKSPTGIAVAAVGMMTVDGATVMAGGTREAGTIIR
jgi:hypothetical protein